MKTITNNKKKYLYVNEKTVDGVTHTLFRRPNKDCRKIITVKGEKYIAVNPDVEEKYMIVSEGKKKILKKDEDVQGVWNKILNTK